MGRPYKHSHRQSTLQWEFAARGAFGRAGARGLATIDCAAASTQGSAGQVVLRDPSDPDDSSSDTTGLIKVARQHLDIEYCARCNSALRSEGAVCVDCEQVFCWWCSVIHMCENRRGEEDEAKLLCKGHMLAAAIASTQGGQATNAPLVQTEMSSSTQNMEVTISLTIAHDDLQCYVCSELITRDLMICSICRNSIHEHCGGHCDVYAFWHCEKCCAEHYPRPTAMSIENHVQFAGGAGSTGDSSA